MYLCYQLDLMFSRIWQIIKDDTKRTYEVCGSAANTNAFENEVYAMQRLKMNVTGVTRPLTNKESSKDLIKIVGYTKEEGLYARLKIEYRQIVMKSSQDFME